MARVTYQPCAVCNTKFPVRPQAPHAKFCSTKCRMQHHRQAKQETASTTIIKEETSLMSNTQSPMQFVFSESEYRQRCQNAKGFYESRIEKPHAGLLGAIVEFMPNTLAEALELYHEHRKAGWLPLDPMAGLPTAMLVESPQATFISVYLRKPPHAQDKDLAKICQQVKADFEKELEVALEAEVERQVQLTLAKDERDRQQALEQGREKLAQTTRDELAASREKLRDELIKSGKLNADGSAA